MLDTRYLTLGLDALSRAEQRDYFADGHLGASVIAAYLLCRENDLDARTRSAIETRIDRDLLVDQWLFAPTPDQAPERSLEAELLDALSPGIDDLREVGHNVIFTVAALEAFRHEPGAVTASRVNGICRLIAAFSTTQNVTVGSEDGIPDLAGEQEMIDFMFREYLRAVDLYSGYGQGWAGHLMTFGQAVLALARLGHPALAARARGPFRMYVKTLRRGPKVGDRLIPDHPPSDLTPLDAAYWEKKRRVREGLGHAFKYAYSFYHLLPRLRDTALRQQCLAKAYQIL